MAEKIRELCKWKREEYVARLPKLRELVSEPRYLCEKCGRVSRKKKWLCRPIDLR